MPSLTHNLDPATTTLYSSLERQFVFHPKLDKANEKLEKIKDGKHSQGDQYALNDLNASMVTADKLEDANLVGSQLKGSHLHAPAIDIDVPISVLPSSQSGHWHLYIDHPVSHNDYHRLLGAMVQCGIVETGFLKAFQFNGQTLLRKPGLYKAGMPGPSEQEKQLHAWKSLTTSYAHEGYGHKVKQLTSENTELKARVQKLEEELSVVKVNNTMIKLHVETAKNILEKD